MREGGSAPRPRRCRRPPRQPPAQRGEKRDNAYRSGGDHGLARGTEPQSPPRRRSQHAQQRTRDTAPSGGTRPRDSAAARTTDQPPSTTNSSPTVPHGSEQQRSKPQPQPESPEAETSSPLPTIGRAARCARAAAARGGGSAPRRCQCHRHRRRYRRRSSPARHGRARSVPWEQTAVDARRITTHSSLPPQHTQRARDARDTRAPRRHSSHRPAPPARRAAARVRERAAWVEPGSDALRTKPGRLRTTPRPSLLRVAREPRDA